MFDLELFVILFIILSVGLFAAIYPLKKYKKTLIISTPVIICAVLINYLLWGGWTQRQDYLTKEAQKQQATQVMKHFENPEALARKLKASLINDAKSAEGWFLLGRLYASVGEWQDAQSSFSIAHKWLPQDEKVTVNYVQSVWQNNAGVPLTEEMQILLENVLRKNPKQPDAISLMAMSSYVAQDYEISKNYWQRLLDLLPENSQEANNIRKIMIKIDLNN